MPDLPGWAWGLIGLAAVAVVWFALRWLTPASSSLRKALAQHLDAKAEHVYVNLPPRPQRYPGALFSRDYGHIYRFAGADDPDLTRGAETQFQHDIDALGNLHGGASAAVFQVLAKASDSLRVELTVSKCRVVEMTVSALAERIAAYQKVRPALPEDLRVIVRGLEGVFEVRVKRRKKVTADAWVKVKKQVKDAADGKASGLDVAGVADAEDSAEIRITASSPDVFAYVAAPVAWFTKPPPPPPAAAVDFSPDVDGALVRLLVHGPSGDPDLKRAFEEIGSEADRTAALHRLVGTEGIDPHLVQRARILIPGPGGEEAPLPPPS